MYQRDLFIFRTSRMKRTSAASTSRDAVVTGPPDQKVEYFTGDLWEAGSSVFSTLLTVTVLSVHLPHMVTAAAAAAAAPFSFITFNPIYSYLQSKDSLLRSLIQNFCLSLWLPSPPPDRRHSPTPVTLFIHLPETVADEAKFKWYQLSLLSYYDSSFWHPTLISLLKCPCSPPLDQPRAHCLQAITTGRRYFTTWRCQQIQVMFSWWLFFVVVDCCFFCHESKIFPKG